MFDSVKDTDDDETVSMVIHSSDGHQYLSGSSELTKDNSYIGSSLVKNIFYPFKFSRICDI